ncbi:MAG: hypothetical protein ACHQ3P_02465 [Candidatus Limnocylindrales bacterium]
MPLPDRRTSLERHRVLIVAAAMAATIVVAIFVGLGGLNSIVPALGGSDWQYVRVFVAALVVLVALFWLFAEVVGPGYMGALWLIGPRVPGIAALAVLLAYIIPPVDHPVHQAAVGIGTYFAFIAWVGLAVLFRGAGYADSSQAKVWSELLQRICQLKSRVDGIRVDPAGPLAAVRNEACQQLGWAEAHLFEPPTEKDPEPRQRSRSGVDWASGTAYLAVWQAVHRAEEAIVEIEPCAATIADALHDDLRLTNSTLTNATGLRLSLQRAVAWLDPESVERYFPTLQAIGPMSIRFASRAPTVPESAVSAVSATSAVATTSAALAAATSTTTPAAPPTGAEQPPEVGPAPTDDRPDLRTAGCDDARTDEMVARGVIREVRFAINEFRDGAWDGLVRSRNRLLRTILVAGVVSVLLLDLAVLSNVPAFNLISAIVFFLVGALVGLFNRLRIEAGSAQAVEDFGLFEARLLHTPLLSGLAAVGGVFLTAILPIVSSIAATGSSTTPAELKPLTDVFDISKNQVGLLVAAVFGLAPNSILTILKDQSDRYKRDLAQSSATSSGASSATAGA